MKESTFSKENKKNNQILIDKMVNEWIEIGAKIPSPKPLFGNIWHEGEVGILFSNTGKGKSLFAVQLADSISRGKPMLTKNEKEYLVMYFDFELSTKAFHQRYSVDNSSSHIFSEKFIRVEIDRDKNLENKKLSFEQLIIDSIKLKVDDKAPDVIIIDNITYLSASNEKSQEALALMKLILDLSRKKNISILLIAHTPKRDVFSPIQLEDLAGSKALSNFVDVVFCIGESIQASNFRYIKQLKNRNYPIEYGSDNVITYKIEKETSFLKFNFIDFGKEKEHLQINKKDEKIEEVKRLKDLGKTNVDIAKQFNVNEKTIRRWLKNE